MKHWFGVVGRLAVPALAILVAAGPASPSYPGASAAPADRPWVTSVVPRPELPAPVAQPIPRALADTTFGRIVAEMSEPGGFFDSDNLVSNELGYLEVLGTMKATNVTGGAYMGVGPDQNFSYIVAVRPVIAFMIDIRRDAMLQHLMYKSLFALSRNRMEYLCQLLAKPVPANVAQWDTSSIGTIVDYLDRVPAHRELFDHVEAAVEQQLRKYHVPLGAEDIAAIRRIHGAFYNDGLDVRYNSLSGGNRNNYPVWRDLLLARDLAGRQANYLASEANFAVLKSLQDRNLVVPVTGNLAGEKAMAAIGRYLTAHGEVVSAFYISNVESYLFRDGSFSRFGVNVAALPRNSRSVIIRSYFGGGGRGGRGGPAFGGRSRTTELLQLTSVFVSEFTRGGYLTYGDVVTTGILENR